MSRTRRTKRPQMHLGDMDGTVPDGTPTHWMPLPDTPAASIECIKFDTR